MGQRQLTRSINKLQIATKTAAATTKTCNDQEITVQQSQVLAQVHVLVAVSSVHTYVAVGVLTPISSSVRLPFTGGYSICRPS